MSDKKYIILGIDPGLSHCGIAVLYSSTTNIKIAFHELIVTKKDIPHHYRIAHIYENISRVIREYKPNLIGIERVFFNKNISSALGIGQVMGISMLAAYKLKIDITELTPTSIKKLITKSGRSKKNIVREHIASRFELPKRISKDEIDAIACALSLIEERNTLEQN